MNYHHQHTILNHINCVSRDVHSDPDCVSESINDFWLEIVFMRVMNTFMRVSG